MITTNTSAIDASSVHFSDVESRVVERAVQLVEPQTQDLAPFDDDAVRRVTDAELSWALTASMTLAVLGATLLAHGSTSSSGLCLGLGSFAIFAIVVLQVGARWRVQQLIQLAAAAQGLPLSVGKEHARAYLKSWFR